MNNPLKYLLASLALQLTGVVALAAPSGAPTEEQTILHASEVYLVQSRQVDGVLHYYIESVWRHDSHAGAEPAIGSEFTGTVLKSPEILIFRFNPGLSRPSGGKTSQQGVQVNDGNVPMFQMSVSDLKSIIQSTQWVPSPAG